MKIHIRQSFLFYEGKSNRIGDVMSDNIVLIIGGDTVPTKSNEDAIARGCIQDVFGKIADVFRDADSVIVNLECPLTNSNTPINKNGPAIKSKPECLNGLLKAGIKVFSLANNHIKDFGETGLSDTIQLMKNNHVPYVGAGANLIEARKPLILDIKNKKIYVISIAEHEFSTAGETSAGSNPYDPFDTIDDIVQAKKDADTVIVLYHGGAEHYRLSSPLLQKTCRYMVDKGADYVICQHSHCVGAYENYKDGHIVYGQGNMLFDYSNHQMWQDGLLVKIIIDDTKKIEFIPIVKKNEYVELAKGKEISSILDPFLKRSQNIGNKEYVKIEWEKICEEKKYFYLANMVGMGNFLRRVDGRLNNMFLKIWFNKKKFTSLYNFLYCESHIDSIKTFLEKNIGK